MAMPHSEAESRQSQWMAMPHSEAESRRYFDSGGHDTLRPQSLPGGYDTLRPQSFSTRGYSDVFGRNPDNAWSSSSRNGRHTPLKAEPLGLGVFCPEAFQAFRGPSAQAKLPQLSLLTGSHTQKGQKPKKKGRPIQPNQDRHLEVNLPGGKLLVAVFDGHGAGGHDIAQRVKEKFENMAPSLAAAEDIRAALHQAFAQCASQVEAEGGCECSGATATVALIDPTMQTVSIAHVGDSTAVLADSGCIVFQTKDHRADAEGERQRLEAHGSELRCGRVCLVSDPRCTFALARSIGDTNYKRQGLSAEPDVSCGLPFGPGGVLVLASDGLWDMVPAGEAVSIVAPLRPQEALQSLVSAATSRWAALPHMDDMTILVVKSVPNDTADSLGQNFRAVVPETPKYIKVDASSRHAASEQRGPVPNQWAGSTAFRWTNGA